jgi:hypothetical protein
MPLYKGASGLQASDDSGSQMGSRRVWLGRKTWRVRVVRAVRRVCQVCCCSVWWLVSCW